MSDVPHFYEDVTQRTTLAMPPDPAPPPVASPLSPVASSSPPEEDDALYLHVDEPDLMASDVASPFQLSNALPTVAVGTPPPAQGASSGAPASIPAPKRKRRLSLPLIAALLCLVVIVGMLGLNALAAQTTPPLHATAATTGTGAGATMVPPAKPGKQPPAPTPAGKVLPTSMPQPTATMPVAGQGTPAGTTWVPAQLPTGWTDAGLTMSDALEAERSAFSFTDHEMSLDYRAIGTRTHHGGTMTAAMFLLTPAARQRYLHNDVRMMNDVLFDQVQRTKLVRSVIDASPQLMQFMAQGKQQFTWVAVSFQLWITQATPQMDGPELDAATGQPRIHTMFVLLLRIPPEKQGANAPMGGTGWLVSTYALDPAQGMPPAIVQPA